MNLLLITPTLGRSQFLDETVRSTRLPGVRVHHTICCPADRVTALQQRFPGSQVVEDQGMQGGLYGAINAGLAAVREPWDFFTYLNDDDLLGRDFAAMFKRHALPANLNTVAFGCITNIDQLGRELMQMTVGPYPRDYPALLHTGISPTGQQGMIFGRRVVESIGFYSTRYKLCGDLDYWCRAMAAGFRFVFYPVEAGKFRIQAGQLSGDTQTTRRELAEIARIQFPRGASICEKWRAKLVYRFYNAFRYLDRCMRSGLKTSYQLLESRAPSTT
jgi:GT2 family glycosyltransferase